MNQKCHYTYVCSYVCLTMFICKIGLSLAQLYRYLRMYVYVYKISILIFRPIITFSKKEPTRRQQRLDINERINKVFTVRRWRLSVKAMEETRFYQHTHTHISSLSTSSSIAASCTFRKIGFRKHLFASKYWYEID